MESEIGKPTKQKRFANVQMILDLIQENKAKIETIDKVIIQIEKREIQAGDEFDSETGFEYLIFFADKSAYLVGKTIIIEDREDYAQALSWPQEHCISYYQEKPNVPPLEVIEKLEEVLKIVTI